MTPFLTNVSHTLFSFIDRPVSIIDCTGHKPPAPCSKAGTRRHRAEPYEREEYVVQVDAGQAEGETVPCA